MIIAYGSDLHLEFGGKGVVEALAKVDADVLVLAGDIATVKDFTSMHNPKSPKGSVLKDLLSLADTKFKKVILVAGNHEHYGGEYRSTLTKIRDSIKDFKNVKFLENNTTKVDDVVFFGATMWTDMGRSPLVTNQIRTSMNDFRKIRVEVGGAYKKFSPERAIRFHLQSMEYLQDTLRKNDGKFVLVQHHAPFFDSIPYYYKNDDLSAAYYSQEFEQRIINGWFTRNPDVIVHGHVHNAQSYSKYGIDVLINTRGYEGIEGSAQDFKFELFSM
jgi:Icc-related predicted phosphoesterase